MRNFLSITLSGFSVGFALSCLADPVCPNAQRGHPDPGIQKLANELGFDAEPTFSEEEERYQRASPFVPDEEIVGKDWRNISCIADNQPGTSGIVTWKRTPYTFFGGYNPSGLQDPSGRVEHLTFSRDDQFRLRVSRNSDEPYSSVYVKNQNEAGFVGYDAVTETQRRISFPSDTNINFDRYVFLTQKLYNLQKQEWYEVDFPDEKNARMEFRCRIAKPDSRMSKKRLLCKVVFFCWAAEVDNSMFQFPENQRKNLFRPAGCHRNRQTIGYCSYIAPEGKKQPLYVLRSIDLFESP